MRAFQVLLALGVMAGLPTVAGAGDSPWIAKLGISQVKPNGDNGIAGVDISTETGLTPAFEYKLSPKLSAEILLAVPFEHDVKVNGVKAGSFKHLPPTISAKYYFSPEAAISPYVGLGLNYTLVFDEELASGAKLKGDDSFGLAATAGVEYHVPDSAWGVALDVRYIQIESDLTVNGADFGTLEVNPLVVGLSAVYHY